MIPDISINGISIRSLGWIRESISLPQPKVQSSTITVPGRNMPVRYTQALGRVSFEPRSISVTLSMLGSREKFNQMARDISNRFNGELCRLITSEEKDLYIVATLTVDTSYDPLTGKGTSAITSDDADSYRHYTEETVVELIGSGTAVLENDYMPAVPEVTLTEETTLSWSAGGDSFTKTAAAGTWTFAELELSQGKNEIRLETTGKTTFRYREGCL